MGLIAHTQYMYISCTIHKTHTGHHTDSTHMYTRVHVPHICTHVYAQKAHMNLHILHTHSPHVYLHMYMYNRQSSQQGGCAHEMSVCHGTQGLRMGTALSFLQLQEQTELGGTVTGPCRREASITQRGAMGRQKKHVTCRDHVVPGVHITCLSSWASPSEMSGSLLCS